MDERLMVFSHNVSDKGDNRGRLDFTPEFFSSEDRMGNLKGNQRFPYLGFSYN